MTEEAPRRWDMGRLKRSAEAPSRSSPGEGTSIGRYVLLREIAAGAMGVVFEADDVALKRKVALKVLHDIHDASEPLRHRFQREAIAAASLSHPNVLQVYDAGEADGRMYLAMELIQGSSLRDVMKGKLLDLRKSLALLVKVGRGLAVAHERGIVHRDIKPANILVNEQGEPKVADFGLAHLAGSNSELTRTGTPLGTPLYMSPEQVRGDRDRIGPATDVYALGVILYEMLVGRTPHAGETTVEIYGRIIGEDPVPPRRLSSKIAADLDTICLKALGHEPQHRYADAGAFADDLQRYLDGEPIRATPPSLATRATRWAGRHRAVTTGVVMASVFLSIAISWEAFRGRRDATSAESQKLLEIARTSLDRAAKSAYRKEAEPEEALRTVAEALARIEEAVAKSPRSALARYLMGRALEMEGRGAEAEAAWRKALEIDPRFGPAHYQLGRLLLSRAFVQSLGRNGPGVDVPGLKLSGEAGDLLAAAMAEGTGFDDDLQRGLAEATSAYLANDTGGVREACAKGVRRFAGRDGVEEFHWLGSCVEGTADQVDALDRAIAIRPWFPLALFCRGLARAERNETDAAIRDFSSALRADPRFMLAHARRSFERLSKGDLDGALEDAEAAVRLDPGKPDGYLYRGQALMRRGDRAGALADLDRAIGLDRSFGGALAARGQLKAKTGDPAGAMADYDEAIRVDPAAATSRQLRASLRLALGRLDEALDDLDRAVQLAPRSAKAANDRAHFWFVRGDPDRALPDADRAIALDPKWATAWLNRAVIHQKARRGRESVADFSEAIRLDAGNAYAHFQRGQSRLLLRDFRGALADTDQAIQLDPKSGDAFFGRAIIREQLQDLEGALKDVERSLELLPRDSPRRAEAEQKRGELQTH